MILRRDGPGTGAEVSRLSHRTAEPAPLILVAVPPTGPVDHLVRFASAVADPLGGQLLLATVVPLPRISPYAAADALLGARSERLARIRERGPSRLRMAHVVVVGHRLAAGLAALARQRGADLLVVGWPRGGEDGARTKAQTSAHDIVKHAPCNVCVVERTPPSPPELVLVSAGSDRETELGLTAAGAMISCSPSPSTGREGPRRPRPLDGTSPAPWPSVEPAASSEVPMDRIAVSDPVPGTNDRTIAERATGLGADVLVVGALRATGLWPLRRTVLRSDLANFFSGPVALVHARDPFPDLRGSTREQP